jgi:serine protease AprX
MASPHVAGAVAVLLSANPHHTIEQVRWALQVTADPVQAVDDEDEPTGEAAPFWQAGYGRVDLAEAVDLVRDPAALAGLRDRQVARNGEVLAATGYRVLQSDWLTYDAPRVSLGGSHTRSFEVVPAAGADSLYVAIAFPGTGALLDSGITLYTVTVLDADGNVVATTERSGEGSASVLAPAAGPGPYTVEVVGDVSLSDPDTLDSDSLLNDTVTVVVAQLAAR